MRLISMTPQQLTAGVWVNIQKKTHGQNIHMLLLTLWNGRGLDTTASVFCVSMFPILNPEMLFLVNFCYYQNVIYSFSRWD